MKIKKEKFLYFIAYALFALCAFLLFFLKTFPFATLEEKALRLLEVKTGCVVRINESHVSFPLAITWEGIDVNCPEKLFTKGGSEARLRLQVASLSLSVALSPLILQQQGDFDFSMKWQKGRLSGHLSVVEEEGLASFTLNELKGEALQVKEIDSGISGRLGFKGEGHWLARDIEKGRGRLVFTLDQAVFKSLRGVSLPLGEVRFEKIAGQVFWKEGRLVAEQFSATGPMVDLESESATLMLRKPFERSLMSLSLRARPKGSIKQMASLFVRGYNGKEALKLRLTGPLHKPKISVNGRSVQ